MPFKGSGEVEAAGYIGLSGADGHLALSLTDHLLAGATASYARPGLHPYIPFGVERIYAETQLGYYGRDDSLPKRRSAYIVGWGHGWIDSIPGITRGVMDSSGAFHYGSMNRWFIRYAMEEGPSHAFIPPPILPVKFRLPGTMDYLGSITLALSTMDNHHSRGPAKPWYITLEMIGGVRYMPVPWLGIELQAGPIFRVGGWNRYDFPWLTGSVGLVTHL
jgi:hypothetical protein